MLGGGGGELGVPVVLAEEDHRQPPHRGKVEGLVERALRGGTVAEERHRDRVLVAEPGRGRCAHRDGQAGRHDAVGAEDPELRVGDVHRAATAPVGPLVPPHQLGEHPDRVEALGQAVPVTAVGRGDDVAGPQGPAGADGGRFLPDGEVDEAGHQPVAVELGDALLEATDQHHAPLQLHQLGAGQGGTGIADRGHDRILY